MPTISPEDEDEILADECESIESALSAPRRTPPMVSVDKFDLSLLAKYRQQHETRQAKEGVRTQSTTTTPSESSTVSQRRQIIKGIHQILKAVDIRRKVGTGLERGARWTGKVETTVAMSGNAANAKVVADAAARQVCLLPCCTYELTVTPIYRL